MASLPFQRPNYAFKNVIATYIESAVDVTICRACMFHVSIIRNNIFFIINNNNNNNYYYYYYMYIILYK